MLSILSILENVLMLPSLKMLIVIIMEAIDIINNFHQPKNLSKAIIIINNNAYNNNNAHKAPYNVIITVAYNMEIKMIKISMEGGSI